MKSFFITATGTGIGKTLVTTALCWQLRQAGKKLCAIKPVMSGYDPMDKNNDAALILDSCGIARSSEAVEKISPWRFLAPLSPDRAAEKEGKSIDFEALLAYCHAQEKTGDDVVLAEGVGGVMTPLCAGKTSLDLMAELGWPVLLVAGSYLGSVSHTLCALEVLRARDVAVRAVLISESEGGVDFRDVAWTLNHCLAPAIPVIRIPRLPAQNELWKMMPRMDELCL